MSGPIRPPLRVREQDGTPSVRPVNTIKVSDGTLTDDGNAVVSIDTSGSGGDTYSLKAATTGSDAEIQLDASTGTDTAVKLAAGSNITLTESGGDTITIASTQASAANPSATVSGTATNGSAATFMRSDAAPALADTAVTAGSYTYTSLTVDAQGRITAASSGTAPSDTTYTIAAATSGSDAEIQLDASTGTDTAVKLAAGSNITLTESGGDTITIAASGGGTPAGSDREIQFNDGGSFGAVSAFKIGSSNTIGIGTSPSSAYSLKTLSNIQCLGTVDSSAFKGTNGGSATQPTFKYSTNNTGFFFSANDQMDFTMGGTNTISFGSAGEVLVGGTASGTSGQVLTSGGSGAAVSWADAGGGGGVTTPEFQATDTADLPSELLGAAGPYTYVGDALTSGQWANGLVRFRPHIMQQAGTLEKARAWMVSAPTGTSSQDFIWAIWNANTSGGVGTLKATATATIATTDSGGIIEAAWAAESGENLTITLGQVVWIGFYSTYGSQATAASFYFIDSSNLAAITRKDTNSSSTTNSIMRYYGPAGTPSSVGDNPTINNADGATTKAWPFMWYTAS